MIDLRGGSRGPVAPAAARNANLATVLEAILSSDGPTSRADVAAACGLTRSTVSRLVDELLAGGLVAELEPTPGRRGRPAVPLVPATSGQLALGLEANVERLVATAVSVSGELVAQAQLDLDAGGLGAGPALQRLGELARDLVAGLPEGDRIVAAHLCVPGLVDRAGQVVLRAPNLGWADIRPADHLGELLAGLPDAPFRVGNDIDASAQTVLREQPDRDASFLYLTGEVGIGAAISMNGTLMTGVHGWASELGHFCVDPGGARCLCGADGCLETVVGLHRLLEAGGWQDVDELTTRLADADPVALEVIDRAAGALGIAIGGALNLLDVERVILGGHLAELGPWLLPPLARELERRTLWSPYSGIEVDVVSEAPRRAAVGAALAAMERVIRDPAAWLDRVAPGGLTPAPSTP